MKKYVAEFIGTFTLVLIGCGTAMLVGCDAICGCGYLLTALAFGLTIVGMAYAVGNVSGCHINPAVSLAFLLTKQMNVKDFIGYVISQCVGSVAATGLLYVIFRFGAVSDCTGGYGANGLSGVGGMALVGLLVEFVLTFIFVLVILGVTSKKANHGSFAGIIIGFTLVLVHIFGIGLTGTSVNPARSLGPAIFAGGDALKSLWVFIVAPLAGGALAALVHTFFEKEDKVEKTDKKAIVEKEDGEN